MLSLSEFCAANREVLSKENNKHNSLCFIFMILNDLMQMYHGQFAASSKILIKLYTIDIRMRNGSKKDLIP